jgi:LmbE family N-acetylglucosaminyl deacetylase
MALKRWTLAEGKSVRLSPGRCVLSWGSVLVLAPHQDDESLGCGGVIALLRRARVPVEIAWLTDGRRSHPNSCAYPGSKLAALRRAEAMAAAKILGVDRLHFLKLQDSRIPLPPDRSTVLKLRRILSRIQVVLTPWRLDPHCDHRAAFAYVVEAARQLPVLIPR